LLKNILKLTDLILNLPC